MPNLSNFKITKDTVNAIRLTGDSKNIIPVRAKSYNDLVEYLYTTLGFTGTAAKFDTIAENTSGSGVTITSQRKTVTASSASTATLTASQSGSTILLDRLAGLVITLPTAAAGLEFTFVSTVSNTSNTYSIEGATSSDLMIGSLINIDTDTSNAVAAWTPNGSSNYKITGNTGTTMLGKGSVIKLRGIAANLWHVEGVTHSTGVVASPFAG